jgi:hypothetical protein
VKLDFRGLIVTILGLVILLGIFIYHSMSRDTRSPVGRSIGEVTEVVGQGQLQRARSHQLEDLVVGRSVWDSDVIQTQSASSVRVLLNNKTQVRIAQSSRVRLEIWDPASKDSPLILVLDEGQIDLRDAPRGKVLVVHNGQLKPGLNAYYTSESYKVTPALAQARSFSSPLDQQSKKSEPSITASKNEPPPPGNSNTLSNEVIRLRLADFDQEFERCRANRIRVSGPLAGEILLGYAIEPKGKAVEVRVVQTNIRDAVLLDCVQKVLATVKFPAFPGEKIYSSHRLQFR